MFHTRCWHCIQYLCFESTLYPVEWKPHGMFVWHEGEGVVQVSYVDRMTSSSTKLASHKHTIIVSSMPYRYISSRILPLWRTSLTIMCGVVYNGDVKFQGTIIHKDIASAILKINVWLLMKTKSEIQWAVCLQIAWPCLVLRHLPEQWWLRSYSDY